MTFSVALLIGGFLALWLVPALWAVRGGHGGGAHSGIAWQRAGLPLALYASLFLAAAWWWHTPLAMQKRLRDFAAAPAFTVRVDCAELKTAIADTQRVSEGKLAVAGDGALVIDGDLWRALLPAQREALAAVAQQIAACDKTRAGAGRLREAQTGAVLSVE